MNTRYIAIVGPATSAVRDALQFVPKVPVVLDAPTLLLACDEHADRIDLGNGRGTIVGTIFDRRTHAPITCLGEDESRACFESGGASLIAQYWGSYVLFLAHEDGRISIVRDPSGATACYTARAADGHVITSDVRFCVSLGLIPRAINWPGVAAHLLSPERRTSQTCIAGVRELMPGLRLVVTAKDATVDAIWTPWQFTSPDTRIGDPRAAAEVVRSTILGTVGAWCSRYPRPLISLSGGLDSSIVMASATSSAGAVTFMTHEASGDERRYAQAVADRCSVPLLERRLSSDTIDPNRSNAASLPRPVSRLFAQELDRVWDEAVRATGADALFHGGGGDNVFCYLASATPYLDTFLAGQPRIVRQAVLDSLSRMARVSHWRIRRAALRKAAIDCGRYRWIRSTRMLTRAAVLLAGRADQHPWFEVIPARTPPGKQAHVAALVRIQNYLEAIEPPQAVPVVAPLMSQPVIEICLRIPTWLWFRDGMNRIVARDAFQERLPADVAYRRSKGSPGAFDARIVTINRSEIRDLLHNGHLAARGLIVLEDIDHALGTEGPLRGNGYLRVTELVDVEAWLQSWIAAPSAAK